MAGKDGVFTNGCGGVSEVFQNGPDRVKTLVLMGAALIKQSTS
jgi:hypothetical protein